MRRTAVIVVCTALALGPGCLDTWTLPVGATDGGRDGIGSGGKGTGGAASTGGRGGSGLPCNDQVELDFEIKKADLVFSVGRNLSMASRFGDTNRMSAVQTALGKVIRDNQNAVYFGYQDFPNAAACFNTGSSCCANPSAIPPIPGAFGAIDSAMRLCDGQPPGQPSMIGCVSQSESRPIADAFKSAINPAPPRFPIFDIREMRDRYLVLIVDGAPVCSIEDSMQSCMNAQTQLAQLGKANIDVYVVPVGEDAEMVGCLKTIAVQANTGTSNVPFDYLARDPNQLMQSLSQIVERAASASCVINLLDIPLDNSLVEVRLWNQTVPRDGQNGWSFLPGSSSKIEVRGNWCRDLQKVQNHDKDIDILPGCPP